MVRKRVGRAADSLLGAMVVGERAGDSLLMMRSAGW